MSATVTFELIPLASLRSHEAVVDEKVRALESQLRLRGVFVEPIWVARGADVILNGHHRVAALRRMGAELVPAWVVDYESDLVRIDRWNPGPPISKAEVLERAREGRLFPPRTTRHSLTVDLPSRATSLRALGGALARPTASHPARRRSSRSTGSRSSRSG